MSNPIQKGVDRKTPGQDRTIRSRVGLTEDPVPEGKHIKEPELHGKMEPVKHDGDSPPLTELSKEDLKEHKKELKQSHDQTDNMPAKSHKLQPHNDNISNMSSMHNQKGQ
ncbi:hypothetical protein WJX84_011536 [Apatococcus fuscideae]|uniref:Uncharacterized protein n=1 Tax=Apatococcus fuscideae TaxID=2026836 RepID=A0AAW1SBT4_9CHLO